ncbi:MAG: aldehyde dehydrogenase family protein, partial [Chloroflexota bacterium]
MRTELAVDSVQMYVGGRWLDASAGERFEAASPATGRVIGSIPKGDREDAHRAVGAAADAAPGWGRASAFERAAAMERIAGVIEARRDELARALSEDQGKPLLAEAVAEVEELLVYWRMAAADATRLEGLMPPSVDAAKRVLVYRVPRGVVSVISPWNWPYTMAAELIAPALAAGNTVVWNPASDTSLCSIRLAACIADADLPPGVFNVVTGPGSVVGDEIAADPRVAAVGFVGSAQTGRRVAERGAGKDLLL